MLNRKYLVPEVHEANEAIHSEDTANPVDVCLDRLETLRSEISLSDNTEKKLSIELQLESLFSGNSTRVITEMERIAIILCRISHRIIQSDSLTETDYSVLLQIFELGLFLAQFKDRWLTHLEHTQALLSNNWIPIKKYANPENMFPPARELVSLAQEYIIRQKVLIGNRCDLCAYALANINGIYVPSLSLLLQQRQLNSFSSSNRALSSVQASSSQQENFSKEALPLNHFYFLLYALAKSSAEKTKILMKWVQAPPVEIESSIFYLSNIKEQEFLASEIKNIRDISAALEIVKTSNSHFFLYKAQIILQAHKRNKISSKAICDLVISTYQKKHVEYTIQILQNISKYNPVTSEFLTKSLIIVKEAIELSEYFFKTAFIIDRDYVESSMLCVDKLACSPKETLHLLCMSDYFGVLCTEKTLFTKVVKTISETHCKEEVSKQGCEIVTKKPWNINAFCQRVIQVQSISVESLEKGLILMLYFPGATNTIKHTVWDVIESKGMASVTKAVDTALHALQLSRHTQETESINTLPLSPEIDHILDVLNHYREISAVQKQLLRISKHVGLFSILAEYDPDVFSIKCIRREIAMLKSDIKGLHAFLMQLKTRDDLRCDSFWFTNAKKNIVLGSSIRSLNSIMMQEDMLYFLNNEEDIVYLLRLVTKRPAPDIALASSLVEKLDIEAGSEEGLVLGGSSMITATVPNKKMTVYAVLAQKEFAGKQSIFRVLSADSEIELFIRDGVLLFRWQGVPKEKKDIIEERERRIDYNFGCISAGASSNNRNGSNCNLSSREWSISVALTVDSKETLVIIDDFVLNIPYGLKPAIVHVGEGFKGILKKALILEESYKKERLSSKPSEEYYIEHLATIEKFCHYYNKFGVLIDSTVPYVINGVSKIRMVNVFKSIGSQWRTSERLCRYIAKLSSKYYQVEEVLCSHVLPPETLPEYLLR